MSLRSFRVIHIILSALFFDNSEIGDLQLLLAKLLQLRGECGWSGAFLLGLVAELEYVYLPMGYENFWLSFHLALPGFKVFCGHVTTS